MELLYLLFIFIYALLLWSMKGHWQKKKSDVFCGEYAGRTAALIPFRNESEHLPGLLIHLAQVLPDSQEVIFIDDGSTDGSAGLIASFIRERNITRWVLLANAGTGKKAALTTGVNFTQAEIILTTDADCILPGRWVSCLTQAFHNHEVQLVAGPVMSLSQRGFFSGFQQLEWASILLMTKFLFSKGRPLMCSGANLAYRKSAFVAVEGYSGNDMHPSGDDEFLLNKIVQKYGTNSVTYLQGAKVLVETHPEPTWGAFFQQRIRWASKWHLHRSTRHAFSAVLAFTLAVIEISTVYLLFAPPRAWLAFLVFWAVKIGMEKQVLGKVLGDYQLDHSLLNFIRTSLLHPVYVILVGVGAIYGKYSWKDRNNKYKF